MATAGDDRSMTGLTQLGGSKTFRSTLSHVSAAA
jgi:hypothetical protein